MHVCLFSLASIINFSTQSSKFSLYHSHVCSLLCSRLKSRYLEKHARRYFLFFFSPAYKFSFNLLRPLNCFRFPSGRCFCFLSSFFFFYSYLLSYEMISPLTFCACSPHLLHRPCSRLLVAIFTLFPDILFWLKFFSLVFFPIFFFIPRHFVSLISIVEQYKLSSH